MSVEQIKVRSRARFRENGGNCFSLSMFLFSIAGFLFVFFSSVRLIFEHLFDSVAVDIIKSPLGRYHQRVDDHYQHDHTYG